MRLDKLPIDMLVVGFLITALLVTFGLAFTLVDTDSGDGEAVNGGTATPGNGETPSGEVILLGDNYIEYNGGRDPAINVAAGEEVTFDINNIGGGIHNIQVDGPDGDYAEDFCTTGGAATACTDPDRMAGGQSGTLTFTLDPGTYLFRCDYHPTEMTGEFVAE